MSDIVIYENGEVALSATVENETIWLSQKQMAELFGKSTNTITEHIKHIYIEGELEENSTIRKFRVVQKEGDREVERETNFYTLDVIISVGYRVKSKEGTKFRIWANSVLKEYLIKGYTLNKERLQQMKFDELDATIKLIKSNIENHELTLAESKGFVEIVSNYARSWALLQGYDEQSLIDVTQNKEEKFVLGYSEAKEAIELFKKTLMDKGEATVLF
jgi:hypothetical protein